MESYKILRWTRFDKIRILLYNLIVIKEIDVFQKVEERLKL